MESTFALRKDDFCVRAFGRVFTFAVQTPDGHPGVLRIRTCHLSVWSQGFQAKIAFSRSQKAQNFLASRRSASRPARPGKKAHFLATNWSAAPDLRIVPHYGAIQK